MRSLSPIFPFVLAGAVSANAAVITLWDFNSDPADSSKSTGTVAPMIGSGTASLLGGSTSTFADAEVNGGSSDPAPAADNSGWNLESFAAQGTGSGSRGAQFSASTAGYQDIVLTFDIRFSNTASRNVLVQYSSDGSTWTDHTAFQFTGGNVWNNGKIVDLSGLALLDDNPNFGLRIISVFEGNGYVAADPTATYSTVGTWRFDRVTLSGSPLVAVPEVGVGGVMGLGLVTFGWLYRRRH